MKLIMAVSKEGYVTRTADDDMSWTGATDKLLFRLLTSVGGHIACGSKTTMPPNLPGRTLHTLSRRIVHTDHREMTRQVHDLEWFDLYHPDGWLVGGQTIAMEALEMDMIDEAFICISDRRCFPRSDGQQVQLQTVITEPRFMRQKDIKLGDVTVEVWRRDRDNAVN